MQCYLKSLKLVELIQNELFVIQFLTFFKVLK